MKVILEKMWYVDHNWGLYVGTWKTTGLLLGLQGGCTKYPVFGDHWVKSNHWIWKTWPDRRDFKIGEKNVLNRLLVIQGRFCFPQLNIKLGLMNQCVKAFYQDDDCKQKVFFFFFSFEKIKAGNRLGGYYRTNSFWRPCLALEKEHGMLLLQLCLITWEIGSPQIIKDLMQTLLISF